MTEPAEPRLPPDHPPLPDDRPGVLIVNLGTPDAATAPAVRRYLAEFLSDKRIVDYPRAIWLPLLYGVILNVRPAKTAKAYKSVWRDETDESPLRFFTRRQAEGLAASLGDNAHVDWAMRYGSPSVTAGLAALTAAGARRILIVPLYPQYSATTTASVHDAIFDAVKAMRWQPAIRLAPAFHDMPQYIDALAATARRTLEDAAPERVLISFHGIPERLLAAGDPYHCHCQKTARLLRKKMGWTEEFAPLSFQSRFGPEKWLGPATVDEIVRAASDGVRRLAVITPGFTADCIETLEEIGIAGAETFREAGGEVLTIIPCLNDSPEMISLLTDIARRELAGWTC